MPTPVFLDTSGLLALLGRDDLHHLAAMRLMQDLGRQQPPLFTSDWVLTELLASSSRQPMRDAAARMTSVLRASKATEIEPASREGWDAAFALYRERRDKEWSLVDCSSILICQARGAQRVFSNDRHFAQAGLEIALR